MVTDIKRPPNGRPTDERIIAAIENLCDQFGVCGLAPPVSIVVRTGQAKWIEAMIAQSPLMLILDQRARTESGKLTVRGVEIKEQKDPLL